jgi:DNA-binding CsgD family transcriptional regulator
VTRRELHRLELYQEFFRLYGVEHQIAFSLKFVGETVVGLGLNRGQRDFREHARSYLNLLRPHCAEAFSLARDWHALTGRASHLEEALATTDEGVLLYSDRGILLHATPRARDRLRRFFGWRGRRQLPAPLLDWIRAERSRLRTGEKLDQISTPLTRELDGARLTVRLSDRPEHNFSVVLVREETMGIAPERLAPLGLTPREASVLVWLAEGKSNAEIGIILGITQETARKHVQHVLDKLGAPNRTSAVRTALDAAGPVGKV